jgi:hypothetical protein
VKWFRRKQKHEHDYMTFKTIAVQEGGRAVFYEHQRCVSRKGICRKPKRTVKR